MVDCIKEIIKNDDLDSFKKLCNLDKYKQKYKINTNLGVSLHLGNSENITFYLANKNGVTYEDYLIIIRQMARQIKKYKDWEKIFLNIFLYNKCGNNEISIIIDKLVNIKAWIIIDYLHIFGYRASNNDLLVFNYPGLLYRNLEKYGYQIRNRLIRDAIIEKDEKNINILINKENYNEWKRDIIQNLPKEIIKTMEDKNFFSMDDLQKDNYMKIACENLNLSVVKYLIELKILPTVDDIYELFCLKLKSKELIYKKRYYGRIKIRKEYPEGYENDIISIIEMLNNKIKIKNNEYIWHIIIEKNFFKLFEKVRSIFKVKLASYNIDRLILKIIKDDNIGAFKKIIEYEIIKIKQGSGAQLSQYMDNAFKNNSKKIMEYLKREYHTRCSKNLLYSYTYNRARFGSVYKENSTDLINNLEFVDYSMDGNIIKYACCNNNIELLKYLVEERKINISSKYLNLALLNNCSGVFINYMLEHINRIPKKNYVDEILRIKNKNWKYRNKPSISMVTNIINKIKGTASDESLVLAIKMGDYNLFKMLHKKFKLNITPDLIYNLSQSRFRSHRIKNDSRMEYIKYIIDHTNIEKISNDHIEKITNMGLEFGDISILKYLESNYNYAPSQKDADHILDNYYCTIEHIDYFLKHNDLKITEQIIDCLVSNRKIKNIEHIYDNYKNKIDMDMIFTIKKINTYTLLGYGGYDFYMFIIEKLKKRITPYTIELFLKTSYGYTIIQTINSLLNHVGCTTETINNLVKSKIIKKSKKFLSKYKINELYEPSEDEKPDNINIIGNILDDEYDDEYDDIIKENKNLDEVDIAIKEAEEKLNE